MPVRLIVGAAALALFAVGPGRTQGKDSAQSRMLESAQLVYASLGLADRPQRPSIAAAADLYVVRATGERVRRLTRTALWEGGPAWSPDGRRIAFSRGAMHCHASECNEPVQASIFVMPASGGTARPLSDPFEDDYPLDAAPTWSPDGRKIAFLRFFPSEGPIGIYVVAANGGPRRWLIAGWAVSVDWSPDGRQIAYVREDINNGRTYLRVVDLRSGRGRKVKTTLPAGPRTAVWSSDGRSLAVTTAKGVFVVPARGGDAQRVVDGSYAEVAWSPDGRQLALSHEPPPSWRRAANRKRIALVRSDGTNLRHLTLGPGSQFSPDWRP